MLRMLGHEIGQRPLQRGHTTEVDVLMDLAQLSAQCRRSDYIAGLPASNVIGLAERADDKGTLVQRFNGQHAGVLYAVEHQVFIDLVADQVDIAVGDQRGQLVEVFAGDQRAAGVVRRIEDDHACARAQGIAELLPVDTEVAVAQLHMHAAATGQFHRRLVAVVARVEDNHFVTGTNDRMDGTEDRFGGTRGNGDLRLGIDTDAIATGDLGRDLLAQGW
ncbi:hypothetical protein D3C76_975910 [compost metagenome]